MYCVETIKSKTKHVCKREKCWIRDGPSKSLRYWKTFFQYHRYNAHKSVLAGCKRGIYITDVLLKIILPIFPWNINVLQDREHNSPVQIFNYSLDICKNIL